jgi:1,4-dihydroxy-2-naphthoate octaprenyltransferase
LSPSQPDQPVKKDTNGLVATILVITAWLRAVRIRFLLASVIAVSNGLAIAFWKQGQFNLPYAILTYAGVVCLHVSVDLLNDYWDYRRGIDTDTVRTKFSGGTGVLPEKALKPRSVYAAGVIFLVLGALIGTYFVVVRGFAIALILGFAVVAIYFYSTSIVNAGLGELFVAIKGAMIVLGACYVQTGLVEPAALFVGTIVGLLSASVLFVNSFPDYAADNSRGRRTLVIIMGKKRAAAALPLFVGATFVLIIAGIFLGYTKIYSLVCLSSLPFAIMSIKSLRENHAAIDVQQMIPSMAGVVTYSRITGSLLAISILL